MSLLGEGTVVLRDAEAKLRALASRAAAGGHYDELFHLADFARQLGALLASSIAVDGRGAGPAVSEKNASAQADNGTGTLPVPDPVRRETKRGKYPRFLREGNQIVKIGWSKKARAEYEHKAPRDVVDVFTERLLRAGRRFTMESVLPMRLADGRELPAYQAYLSLAWLRACGLVDQHGRKGYSVPNRKELEDRVRDEWTRLAER